MQKPCEVNLIGQPWLYSPPELRKRHKFIMAHTATNKKPAVKKKIAPKKVGETATTPEAPNLELIKKVAEEVAQKVWEKELRRVKREYIKPTLRNVPFITKTRAWAGKSHCYRGIEIPSKILVYKIISAPTFEGPPATILMGYNLAGDTQNTPASAMRLIEPSVEKDLGELPSPNKGEGLRDYIIRAFQHEPTKRAIKKHVVTANEEATEDWFKRNYQAAIDGALSTVEDIKAEIEHKRGARVSHKDLQQAIRTLSAGPTPPLRWNLRGLTGRGSFKFMSRNAKIQPVVLDATGGEINWKRYLMTQIQVPVTNPAPSLVTVSHALSSTSPENAPRLYTARVLPGSQAHIKAVSEFLHQQIQEQQEQGHPSFVKTLGRTNQAAFSLATNAAPISTLDTKIHLILT